MYVILIFIYRAFRLYPQFNDKYYETHEKPGEISEGFAYVISIPLAIFYVVVLTLFYKKRNHYLINFRPLTLCMLTGGCTAIYSVLLPILIAYQKKWEYGCFITISFTEIFATMSMMANISRYFKLYLLNRRDIGKMKLYNENFDTTFPGKEESVDGFEPNAYVKRLNKLVSKRITLIFFIIPYISLIIVAAIFLRKSDRKCGSNAIVFYIPMMVLSLITLVLIPFFFIELTKARAINRINQFDMILNYVSLFSGSLLFVSTLFAFYTKVGDQKIYKFDYLIHLKSTSLFFIIPSFGSCVCANLIPLIEAYRADRKLKKKKFLSKKDFTRLLMGSSYIEALKSVAVRSYCVETVIFWEMHMKLMKMINASLEVKQQQQQQRSSITKVQNQRRSSMSNIVSSPVSPNYDLLLGLNKNIFGSSNNEILYTGSFGEEIDPTLVNAINHGTDRVRDYYAMNNRNRAFSDSARINGQNYMNINNIHPNNSYNYSNRHRNDSMLSSSTNNSYNQNYNNNYYLDTLNSDKTELLKHQDFNYSNSTSINISSNIIRNRRNATKNAETEVLYELFEVESENIEVPQRFWKDFDNIYNSFISDQSLATVNLDVDTVNRLKKSLKNKEYTMDMFFPALAETVELIYQNLYPKLLAR